MASRRFAQVGLLAALCVFIGCMSIVLFRPMLHRNVRVADTGAPAADFKLPDADSIVHSLDDARGKVVLLFVADPSHCDSIDYSNFARLQRDYINDARVEPFTILRTDAMPGTLRAQELCRDVASAGVGGARLLDLDSEVWHQYRLNPPAGLFVIDSGGTIRLRSELRDNPGEKIAEAKTVMNQLLQPPAASAQRPGILAAGR